jgi:DNA-binding transcriptional ArsR family regulator
MREPPAGPPVEELRITDLETVRVLADPLRFRLVQTMSARIDEPWTVKEIARALGEPATKLYYHVGLLEERGLIVVVGSRLVSGIVEKRYRLAAERFVVDRGILSPEDPQAGEMLHSILTTVFDAAQRDIRASVRAGIARAQGGHEPEDPDHPESPEPILLSHSVERLPPAQGVEFRSRLRELVTEFEIRSAATRGGGRGRDHDAVAPTEGDETRPYGLVLAFYPLVEVPSPRATRRRRATQSAPRRGGQQ